MVSKELEKVMEDNTFLANLEELETEEKIKAAFAEKGLDFEKEFAVNENEEKELDEDSLGSVSGGAMLTTTLILAAAPYAWKAGKSAGILIRSAYDAKKYGNPYRSYSKSTVESVMKKIHRL